MGLTSDKKWVWLGLQIIVPFLTICLELFGIITWNQSINTTYKLLVIDRKTLESHFFGLFSYLERAIFTLYGVAIIFLETKLLSSLEDNFFSAVYSIHYRVQTLSRVIFWGLSPLLFSSLIFIVSNQAIASEAAFLISLLTLGIGSIALILTAKSIKRDPALIRGAFLLPYSEVLTISKALTENDPLSIHFGGVYLPSKAARHHSLIVGEPGAGKSKSIQLLMESSLGWIGRGLNHRAVIYDPKRNTRSILAGMKLDCDVHILDAFDRRGAAWDIAKDITDPDVARTIAEALVPEERNTTQPYFRDTAALVVSAVIQALAVKSPQDWSLRDLVLIMRRTEMIKKFVSSVPETEHYIAQHCEMLNQTFQSVLSQATGKIDWLNSVAAAWENAPTKISFSQWVKSDESILLLGSDKLRRVAMAELNRMMLTYLSLAVLNLPDDDERRNWFFLDEFTSLGRVDVLKELLYHGRSKGACVLIAFQEIAQLIEHYGEEGQRIITANTANKMMLRASDPSTQKWNQSFFGVQEKYESSHSKNSSLLGERATWGKTESIRERSLVLPSEFGMLPLASRENGISGYAKNPWIGSYRFNVSGEIIARLAEPDPAIPDFCEREVDDRKIKPFTKEETSRLLGPVASDQTKPELPPARMNEKQKVQFLESWKRIEERDAERKQKRDRSRSSRT